MSLSRFLPETVRSRPGQSITVRVASPGATLPADTLPRVEEALRCARVGFSRTAELEWQLSLEWSTPMLGAINRRTLEQAALRIDSEQGRLILKVSCEPIATHDAHAAGAAVVIVLAVCAWLLGGWASFGVPIGLTTLLAGASLVAAARRMALQTLERRLSRLAADVAEAVWPRAGLLAD